MTRVSEGVELLTIGEAFDDLIFAGLNRLPRPGEEFRVPTFAQTIGGGALITAVAAARLGLRVATMTAASEAGARLLRAERVTLIDLRRASERAAVSVALSTRGDRAFVTFEGVNRLLEPRLLSILLAVDVRPRHVHFALSPLRCRRWLAVIRRMRARGCTTSWDFGWNDRLLADRAFDQLLDEVDWLFVNEREAKLYARVRSVAAAARHWRARRSNTVIKVGPRGAIVLVPGAALRAAPPSARVVDTTGAGEAFNGGFIAALVRGTDMTEALRLGNYVGARSTEGLGGLAALPQARDLPKWARQRLEAA